MVRIRQHKIKELLDFHIEDKVIDNLDSEELDKLTKLAAIIDYIGNRKPKAKLYNWIYSDKLKLDNPYTPGLESESFARIKRIISAHREFSLRNVFFDEKTIKPI